MNRWHPQDRSTVGPPTQVWILLAGAFVGILSQINILFRRGGEMEEVARTVISGIFWNKSNLWNILGFRSNWNVSLKIFTTLFQIFQI